MSLYYPPSEFELPNEKPFLKRIFRRPMLEQYKRLFVFVVMVNLIIAYQAIFIWNWWQPGQVRLDYLQNMVIGNFFAAIIIRQQYVINFLFWAATRAPTSWPLRIRWTLGKVYHFGGIHSSAATMGTSWFVIFFGSLSYQLINGSRGIDLVSVSSLLLTVTLIGICIMSLPKVRGKFHNSFEKTHRFGGWFSLILFWTLSVGSYLEASVDASVLGFFREPTAIALMVITFSIALPWLRLKKVKVEQLSPSNHVALSRFNYGVKPFAGSSTAISRNPLFEWHAFANVPSPNEDGFRLTISRAGDWTGQYIDDLPEKVWVKGIPTAGVANIEVLFKRVVYVATGSGIGPCLPHLLAKEVPSLLVWSTRTPEKTYGQELVDEIKQAQPDAIIWDTTTQGKPDMVELAYRAYKQFDAEAVICISNQKLTNQVVYGMESRGIPAYGAIWDS